MKSINFTLAAAIIACCYSASVSADKLYTPTIQRTTPGDEITDEYQELIKQADKDRLKEAQTDGVSAFPTLNALQQLGTKKSVEQETGDQVRQNRTNRDINNDHQANLMNKALRDEMMKQMADIQKGAIPKAHKIEDGIAPKAVPAENAATIQAQEKPKGGAIPAGTVLYGYMVTELNSDDQGPVLAKIVQGPLNGGTLLGEYKVNPESVVIKFNLVSFNGKTAPINAVAVDPSTARTGLATDVDHHYFLRYGMIAASAFLSALGEVAREENAQVVAVDGVVVQQSGIDPADTAKVAAGNIGDALSESAKETFNTPPTITVDSGTGIGVLFMDEFKADWLPESNTALPSVFQMVGGQ